MSATCPACGAALKGPVEVPDERPPVALLDPAIVAAIDLEIWRAVIWAEPNLTDDERQVLLTLSRLGIAGRKGLKVETCMTWVCFRAALWALDAHAGLELVASSADPTGGKGEVTYYSLHPRLLEKAQALNAAKGRHWAVDLIAKIPDLGPTAQAVLRLIAERGSATDAEVSSAYGMVPSRVADLFRGLERRDLIEIDRTQVAKALNSRETLCRAMLHRNLLLSVGLVPNHFPGVP